MKKINVERIEKPYLGVCESGSRPIKALLRKEAARTIDTLWAAIGRIIDIVTPT